LACDLCSERLACCSTRDAQRRCAVDVVGRVAERRRSVEGLADEAAETVVHLHSVRCECDVVVAGYGKRFTAMVCGALPWKETTRPLRKKRQKEKRASVAKGEKAKERIGAETKEGLSRTVSAQHATAVTDTVRKESVSIRMGGQ